VDAVSILESVAPIASKVPHLEVQRGEVVVVCGGGGGGMGDPLLREPRLVAEDVVAGYITAEHALAAYGVVLDSNSNVEDEDTASQRLSIRRERISSEPQRELVPPAELGIAVVIDGEEWKCGSCGEDLGRVGTNWRDSAVVREVNLADRYRELAMYVRPREDPPMVMREFFCPSCAHALVVDVVTDGYEQVPAPRFAEEAATRADADKPLEVG
jgi:N-methylhydantoinase B